MDPLISRRRFLKSSVAITAGIMAGVFSTSALPNDFWSQPRSIWMVNAKTGEQVRATYFSDGAIIEREYLALCNIMRDTHAGITAYIDPVLLDIFSGTQGWFRQAGQERVLVLNSGYRAKSTNARALKEGAARNSLHMEGRAGDIWIPDVPTEYLARLGVYLRGGGVGYYPSKRFVHVDSGGVRVWTGGRNLDKATPRSSILIR